MRISSEGTSTGREAGFLGEALGARATGSLDPEKLRQATRDFEAVFIGQMFQAMRKAVPESGLFGQESAGKTFRELLDQEWAGSLAAAGGLGIGEMLYRQLTGEVEPVSASSMRRDGHAD